MNRFTNFLRNALILRLECLYRCRVHALLLFLRLNQMVIYSIYTLIEEDEEEEEGECDVSYTWIYTYT